MTRLIALYALLLLGLLLALGNYWYTFGLWPRSWAAFIGFALASMLWQTLLRAVWKDKA